MLQLFTKEISLFSNITLFVRKSQTICQNDLSHYQQVVIEHQESPRLTWFLRSKDNAVNWYTKISNIS